MFSNRISSGKRKKRAVLTAYGTPDNVVMVSVTIHTKGDDPYVMAFFRDPTEADPESLLTRAHDWAGKQGIKSMGIVESPYPVTEAFCDCCGELRCIDARP